MLGATTASPVATARIAVSRSGGGTFLSRKPLAPALAGEGVLVKVERGEDEDPGSAAGRDDPPGCLDSVEKRHPYVHEHHIRLVLRDDRQRLFAVAGFGHHPHVLLGVEHHAETEPPQRRSSTSTTEIVTPVPPTAAARESSSLSRRADRPAECRRARRGRWPLYRSPNTFGCGVTYRARRRFTR